VVADAYAGLGEVSAALAERAHDEAEGMRLWAQSRAAYESSLSVWHQIPVPLRISPAGFASGDPLIVQRRLNTAMPHLSGSSQP
jgi:hypothetical protein